jgi:histidinol-phosphate/aromatic aminotransferase/cobyric acid decarboxylase-like protein
MPRTADRLLSFEESVIREMTRVSNRNNAINLAQGFPDFDPPQPLLDALAVALRGPNHQYAITWGAPRFRAALARKIQHFSRVEVDPDAHLVVTCGSTEAMMVAMMTACNPGDRVIVFSPFYENYAADAILSGADPVHVLLHPPEFRFDPAELRQAFEQIRPKALVLCNPSNPSGKVFSRQELEFIAALAVEHDAFVITDEVYEHIIYPPAEHVSIATLPGMRDRTITCNSLSKTYSITGWRLGYVWASATVLPLCQKTGNTDSCRRATGEGPGQLGCWGIPAILPDSDKWRAPLCRCRSNAGFSPSGADCGPPRLRAEARVTLAPTKRFPPFAPEPCALEETRNQKLSALAVGDFLGHYFEFLELVLAEGHRDRDITGIPASTNNDSSNPALIVSGIKRIPAFAEKDLEPGAEIHRIRKWRNADVPQIAGDVACRDVETTTKRDGQVSKIATDSDSLPEGFQCGSVRSSLQIIEFQVLVNKVTDSLNPGPAQRRPAKCLPGEIQQLAIDRTVTARQKVDEFLHGDLVDFMLDYCGIIRIELA